MKDGDFIKVNFEMYVGDEKKLVSTNNMQLAKDNDIYDEKLKYKETVLVVGSESLFKEINESFLSAEVGKEYEVKIKAEDAYGLRDSKNVKVHTYREFQRQNVEPALGQEVSLNGRRGRVVSLTPGRILVDYNHQWAGKDVVYKYTVTGIIENNVEKMKALIDFNYPVDSEKFEVSENGTEIEITVPEETKFDAMWLESKFRVVNDARKYLKDYSIRVSEVYKPDEKPAPEAESPSDQKEAENKPEPEEKKVEEENSQ